MSIKRAVPVIIALLWFGAGCQTQTDREEENNDLFQTDLDFARMSEEKGAAEAFNMYLADNAIQLPDGREPITGRSIIYDRMKNSKMNYVLTWEPQSSEVAESGDMGYTWGNSTLMVKEDNGGEKKYYGKYLNVWKKEPGGSWKVIIDMGNESPTPEEDQSQ